MQKYEIGEQLRMERMRQKLTQRQAAERAGLSVNTVAAIEQLRSDRLSKIQAYAKGLGRAVKCVLIYKWPMD